MTDPVYLFDGLNVPPKQNLLWINLWPLTEQTHTYVPRFQWFQYSFLQPFERGCEKCNKGQLQIINLHSLSHEYGHGVLRGWKNVLFFFF